MNFRAATEADIPRITEMKNRPDESRYKERIQKTAEGSAMYLVAEEDGKVVGQAYLKFFGTTGNPDHPDIEDIYVDQSLRSKGLGTDLIQKCEELAREKGFKKIGLGVNPTLNPRALALYERLGFKDTGKPPYLDGVYDGVEDWVITMSKDL